MSLRQSYSNNPVFLTSEQFSQLFNQNVSESQYIPEFQPEAPREMSFAYPQQEKHLDTSVNCSGSFIVDQKDLMGFFSQKKLDDPPVEQTKMINDETYQRMFKQNKDLLGIRQKLEEENKKVIEENFQLKRQTQDLQKKLQQAQNVLQLKRDQEILALKQQIKDLQAKLRNEREKEFINKTIQMSPSEISTAYSTKSHSQVIFGGQQSHRVQSNEQSKNPSRFTSPIPTKCFDYLDNPKLYISQSFNVQK